MKKVLLLTAMFLSGMLLAAQQADATYKNGSDSLAFIGGKAVFRLTGFAGLSTAQAGEGSFTQIEHFLLVETSEYSGPKSASQVLASSKQDSCVVKVVGSNNFPLQNILVEGCTHSGKVLEARVSDNDGKIYFRKNDKMEKIDVSAMGYNAISVDYNPGEDYLIRLSKDEIIENNTVVFTIQNVDDETISILLLSDNFKEGKNRLADLQKLEKKMRKRNLLDKRLKKVYVPYARKI